MIQVQSYLSVSDNTGAKEIMCIRVLKNNRVYAGVGDIIIGVVKRALPNMAVKRSAVVRAIIIRTRHDINRADGTTVRFDDNAAVLVNAKNEPRGTRIFGPVAREVREKGYQKIVSLANEVV